MVLIERAVRRSKIPVKSSEGFNPRLRISFPTALPLGISSNDEVIFVVNSEWMSSGEILNRLKGQFIPGIKILSVEPLSDNRMPLVTHIEYQIIFNDALRIPTQEKINAILGQEQILVKRNKKDCVKIVDIRRFIVDISTKDNKNIILVVKYGSDGSVSPSEVLPLMNINIQDERITVLKNKTIFNYDNRMDKSVLP
jgi:radical SAM-linked protein